MYKSRLCASSPPHARAIGILADTHCMGPRAEDLADGILRAFDGVDLILHCGDLGGLPVLDRLATVAPVLGTRSPADPVDPGGRTVAAGRVIHADGLRIGVAFDLVNEGLVRSTEDGLHFPDGSVRERLAAYFEQPVDVVAFGGTHRDVVAVRDGVLFVNPGSPRYPAVKRDGEIGTVALLRLRDGTALVETVHVRAA
ncbi:MAG: metallophosphoesterase family protein [Deltaproteobacteria bacterium]|nr:metallophosphoesterase family protein [Deltaproteobacteria bacterium]